MDMYPPQMVQCQRTRHYMTPEPHDGDTWRCPCCPGRETYRYLGPGHFAHEMVHQAMAMCRAEFDAPEDKTPTVVWLGDGPEAVFERKLGGWHIYLGRDSDRWQWMYSGAHETFHRVCTPPSSFHWAHEMLAVRFSLIFLERIGELDHAARNREALISEAPACSLEELLGIVGVPYPPGTYGRAHLLCDALIEAVGWDRLKPLALTRTADGRPCVDSWLYSLARPGRDSVCTILGGAGERGAG